MEEDIRDIVKRVIAETNLERRMAELLTQMAQRIVDLQYRIDQLESPRTGEDE